MYIPEKKIEGRPVLARDILLNNEAYTLYKYQGGKLIFAPKNIAQKIDKILSIIIAHSQILVKIENKGLIFGLIKL